MYNKVKVQYEIRDGGEQKVRSKTKTHSSFKSQSSPGGKKSTSQYISSSNNVTTPAVAPILNATSSDGNKSIRPKSAVLSSSKRSFSKALHAADWVNPWGHMDLDSLRIEQDMAISKYKLKHEEYSRVQSSPRLLSETARLDQKNDKSLTQRERLFPNTTGKIVNNELPFHPFLKHQDELLPWSVQTLPNDDPERARPDSKKDRMSREYFHQTYDSMPSSVFDKITIKHAVPVSDMRSLASHGKI